MEIKDNIFVSPSTVFEEKPLNKTKKSATVREDAPVEVYHETYY
jgi:hypothetical protein